MSVLGVIAAAVHAPAANWSKSHKITGLANGSASTDAAAFGQIVYGGIFGDGSDGFATLDETATAGWASKSSSPYMMTRGARLTSHTISSGLTLNASGYKILCIEPITNGSTISANVNATSGTTAGTATTPAPWP